MLFAKIMHVWEKSGSRYWPDCSRPIKGFGCSVDGILKLTVTQKWIDGIHCWFTC